MGVLASGTALAQAISVLVLPVLTRLYTPADFDLLAVYASALGLGTVVACLRFNIAIPLPADDATGMDLLLLALLAGLALALLVALPVLLAPDWAAGLIGSREIRPYLWMLPVGIALAAAYDALQFWATRKRRYGLVSKTRMVRAGGGAVLQGGFGALAARPFGLLFGHMAMNGLGVVGLMARMRREDNATLRDRSISSLRATARRYRRFPLLSVPEALLNTAGLEVSILIIAAWAIGPEAGFLMLALRVMGIPMSLIGISVGQVFLTEAPDKLRSGELAAFTRKTIGRLLLYGGPLIVLIGLVSPIVFPIAFGPGWERAGEMMIWLAPLFVLQFAFSPVSFVFQVAGRLGAALLLQLAGCVVRIGALVVAIETASGLLVETFAVVGAAFYALALVVVVLYADRTPARAGARGDPWDGHRKDQT